MYIVPKDSRQRYTKQCLFDAFLRTLENKAVSDITVIEVSEDAGISRKTFYKYYSDQFALLKAMQDDLFAGFKEEFATLPDDVLDIAPALITFLSEHKTLIRATFENRGKGNFIDKVILYLYNSYHGDWEKANPSISKEDVEFLFHYVTSGLMGIIRLWLFCKPDVSVDELIQKAEHLMKFSISSK